MGNGSLPFVNSDLFDRYKKLFFKPLFGTTMLFLLPCFMR